MEISASPTYKVIDGLPVPIYPAMKCVYCAITVTEPDEDHMYHCHDTDGWFMSCGAMGNGGPKATRDR
jgi:hypothetical protein